MITKHIDEPVDRAGEEREAIEQEASSLEHVHAKETTPSPAPRLLLIHNENGSACTAEGCRVSFGKEN